MDEKVKTFVTHILQECEQEGFTLTEALQIPQELKFALEECVSAIHKSVKITDSRTAQ